MLRNWPSSQKTADWFFRGGGVRAKSDNNHFFIFLTLPLEKQNFELEHEDFCTKESANLFQEILKLGYEIFKPGWPLEKLRGCANKYYEMDLLLIKGRNFNYHEKASFLEIIPRIKLWGWESKNDYAICSVNNYWLLLDSIIFNVFGWEQCPLSVSFQH